MQSNYFRYSVRTFTLFSLFWAGNHFGTFAQRFRTIIVSLCLAHFKGKHHLSVFAQINIVAKKHVTLIVFLSGG
jgi:hypothetical protein